MNNNCSCANRAKSSGVVKVYVNQRELETYTVVIVHSERCELEFKVY